MGQHGFEPAVGVTVTCHLHQDLVVLRPLDTHAIATNRCEIATTVDAAIDMARDILRTVGAQEGT